MTSSIEKAAHRLEQLRNAGVVNLSNQEFLKKDTDISDTMLSDIESAKNKFNNSTNIEISSRENRPVSKKVEINLTALASAGYLTPNSPRTTATDQFRVIKRPLLDNATGKGASMVINGNLIMVTSSLPGEGKSFTAINLAMSLAMELNHTVLLVDADVARPSIMEKLGLEPAPGLLDLLLDKETELSDVLLRTNVPKLTLLPTGRPHPRATELLTSTAMAVLLEDLARRYQDRIIIFDSPPLLLTTEARVLATHMGQILIIVQAEKTLQSQVMHALSTIEACPVKLMVLNQARTRGLGAYGYGYGYGYGYDENQQEERK
jgi:receptor protein-tyrosine kinase